MRVELVEVAALLAAYVALPRVALAVAALVQEVQGLVRERDPAVGALEAQQPLLGPRGARRLAPRVAARIRPAGTIVIIIVVVVIVPRAGGELPAQVVPEQGLERRDLDQRRQRQIAGRSAVLLGPVAARLLLYRYQRYRRGDRLLAAAEAPVNAAAVHGELMVAAAGSVVAVAVRALRTVGAVAVQRRRARAPLTSSSSSTAATTTGCLFRVRYRDLDVRREEVHRRRGVVRGAIAAAGAVAAVRERRRRWHRLHGGAAV